MRKIFLDENIDFIGFAITPLQVKNIIAFAKAFKITGTVLVAPHIKTGYPKNINELKNHKIQIIKIDEPYEEFENKRTNFSTNVRGKELLFLTAFFKDDWAKIICESFPNRSIKYMIIDSGLGSYNPDIDKEIRNRISDNVIDARKYIKKNDNTFCLNEKYADIYINALRKAKIKNKKLIDKTIKDSILICTQPLIEDGIIDDKRDVMLYEKIIKLAKSKNLKVCIKLHPREKINKYIGLKTEFLRSNNTMEEILANCEKPRCIISPFSTVMMDAWFFHNIPSYGVYKMLNIKGYDYIKEDYAGFSAFPTSIEDIHEL